MVQLHPAYLDPVKVTADALRLLEWAARELNDRRGIYSAPEDGAKFYRLDMKGLTDRP